MELKLNVHVYIKIFLGTSDLFYESEDGSNVWESNKEINSNTFIKIYLIFSNL